MISTWSKEKPINPGYYWLRSCRWWSPKKQEWVAHAEYICIVQISSSPMPCILRMGFEETENLTDWDSEWEWQPVVPPL